jgi:hypothetical protein
MMRCMTLARSQRARATVALATCLMTMSLYTAHAQVVEDFATISGPIGIDYDPFNDRLIVSRYYNPNPGFQQVDRNTRNVSTFAHISQLQGSEFYHLVLREQWGPYVAGTVITPAQSGSPSVLWSITASGTAASITTTNAPTASGYTKVLHDTQRDVLYFINESANAVYKVSWNSLTNTADFQLLASNITRPEGAALLANDSRYGPWAGKLVVLENDGSQIFAIDPDTGTFATYNIGIGGLEAIYALPFGPQPSLFVSVYGENKIKLITYLDQAGIQPGDLFIASEMDGRIYQVSWDASQNRFVTQLRWQFGQIEDMVAAPVAEPASLLALGAGLGSLVRLRRRKR